MSTHTKLPEPKDDFYYHVNKEWLESNPIPNDYSRWGSFEVLIEETNKKVKKLFDEPDSTLESTSDDWSKVLIMWSQGNDEITLNNQNNTSNSIEAWIQEISNISNVNQIVLMMGKLFLNGITSAIDFGSCPDLKNSELNILWIDRNNLGLPDRDYYFNEKMTEKVSEYKLFLVKTLDWIKCKFPNVVNYDSEETAKNIFNLEIKLAESMMTMTERRNPSKIYNAVNVTQLKEEYQNINWQEIFNLINVNVSNNIICNQEPKFIKTLNDLLVDENLEIWKYYSMLKIVWSTFQFLDDEINNMCFNFYGTILNGQNVQKPRWKRVMGIIDALLGELVGKKYCSLHFTQESKDSMLEIIKNILETFEHKINNLTWMSDETKLKAIEKLKKLDVKIGFPDKWEKYDKLNVSTINTYCQNVMECYKFKVTKDLATCYLPVDKQKWHMFPHQINAYYNPTQNEIVFPAGILQYPIFDKNQPFAINYGGIGAVISHEIGHAFDDSGSQFDAEGNLNNWWTDQDKKNYKNATLKMVEQFNNYIMEGMQLNGELELGENIADHSGVTISLSALIDYCKKNNIDEKKEMDLFFRSFATIWRNNIKPDALKNRLISDPHAPGYYRTNGILSNVPEFYELYNVTENDKMYLEPSKRTILW